MTQIGRNPLTVIGTFLSGLGDVDRPSHPELGRATISPTLIRTDQTSANVIPGEVFLTLDCRTVPPQTAESVRADLLPLLRAAEIEGSSADILIPQNDRVSYTGYAMTYPADNPAHSIEIDHPALTTAVETLASALGGAPPVDVWQFATDGGHFAEAGMVVVGFGPGDDRLAHTVNEHILIDDLEVGMRGNETLARDWPASYAAACS
jgi:acetylornithine deacetylase/succinyl-diaminopimelate desuccinylase-like protein